MLIGYRRGQGSIVLRVKILNSSVSTGAGLTGLTNASTGLVISTIADNEATATAYTVAASNVETITTLGTYAAPTAGKCRFKEVDATNHKGVYEIQLADARFAVSSAKSLLVSVLGATNAAETDVVIPLRDLDPYDGTSAGLSRLDAAVSSRLASASYTTPPAAGAIADAVWDEAYATHTTAGTFGKLLDTLRKANYVTEGSVSAGGTPTTTSFRTTLTAADGTFDNQTLLFLTGTLAGESVPILTYEQANGLITTQEALTVAPTAADEFVVLPDHVHSIPEIVSGVLTTQMTESYRATNAAPTLAQAAFELIAHMGEAGISGTTKTLRKIDGSTTAKTYTLDSSMAPTSITETT